MKNEVTKTQETNVAVFNDSDFGDAGNEQELSKQDILIPKILIMQGQSPLVLEGEASFGDLRDTLENTLMGKCKTQKDDAQAVTCIPFHREKFWINKSKDGEKWKFESIVPITSENAGLDQYGTWVDENDKVMKRILLILFYVMIPGKNIPYTIGFRGSSLDTGKALGTQMYVVNKGLKVPEAYKRSPMGKVIDLVPKKVSKNDNTYCVLEMRVQRETTFEEACEAMTWYKSIKSGETTADHSDITGEEEAPRGKEF